MSDQNGGENPQELLQDLSAVAIERDQHLKAAERLRLIRDDLIERAIASAIPRKTIAAASLLQEISLYKMMARRALNRKTASEPDPDLFSSAVPE